MKRHILEVTEIDCGDETCDGCQNRVVHMICGRFGGQLKNRRPAENPDAPLRDFTYFRLPECLEAERAYNGHPFFDPTQTIYPRPK